MSWTGWVFKNLFRNRRRTLLTGASVAVSLFLLAMFSVTYRYLEVPPARGTQLVLIVQPRASIMLLLPLGYREQIAAVPGVAAVSPFVYVAGNYGSGDTLIPVLGLDPKTVFQFFSDFRLPEHQKEAFITEKVAMIAPRKMADKFGWKVGDRIHLTSRLGPRVTFDLVLRGIYTTEMDNPAAVFHWEYWNDAFGNINKTPQFWAQVQSGSDIAGLCRAIDERFRNAPIETRTETLRQVFLNFLSLLGNVQLVLLTISAAVLFAVLSIVTNTMAMSIRERTAELAVMRALGFEAGQVTFLLAAESAVVSLAGALVACLAAWGGCKLLSGFQIGGAVPAQMRLDVPTMILTLLVALAISLASTLLPAYRASRVPIPDALRFVG